MTKEEVIKVLTEARLYEIEHEGDSPKGEALKVAISALRTQQKQENECVKCSGIVYRQTDSGKIIPVSQRCGAKITPPCYVPDGDGCAYQIYGDNNDEPIARCKSCPLCQSDKTRHKQKLAHNNPLTMDELREMDGEPVWIVWPDGRIKSHWWIVGNYDWRMMEFDDPYTRSDYGKTWIAYRHKPEENAE